MAGLAPAALPALARHPGTVTGTGRAACLGSISMPHARHIRASLLASGRSLAVDLARKKIEEVSGTKRQNNKERTP